MRTRKMIIGCLLLIAGTMLSPSVNAQQINVPAKVKAVAQSKSAGHEVIYWGNDKFKGYYVATLANTSMIIVSTEGKWLKSIHPILDGKLPPVAHAAISPYLKKGNRADNIVITEDTTNGKYYNVDVTSADDVTTFYIDMKGKIFKKEKRQR